MKNNQLLLVSRPLSTPKENNFRVESTKLAPLKKGESLIKNLYLSIDPAMRSWMNEGKSYINPIQLGTVMRAMGTGLVIDSKDPNHPIGEYVCTNLGMQDFKIFDEKELGKQGTGVYVQKIPDLQLPLPTYLGALGIPGMTAYFGLLDVAKIEAGETIVISGAAGGVGTIAGQIAKLKGCTVIGLTSSDEKCDTLVKNYKFDVAVNYKTPNWREKLMEISPSGVNVFFDNVGGDVLNIMLTCMSKRGRIVLSGAASQYNNMAFMRGPANYLSLLVNRAKMEGFVNMDYVEQFDDARIDIVQWIKEGKINADSHIVKGGVDQFLPVLTAMFAGQNMGKMILELPNN
jgi:NADPH-dependent curcumin reductase